MDHKLITPCDLPQGRGYLASPYTHPDPEVRAYRAKAATSAWLWLLQRGLVVYPPITAGVGAGLILGQDLPPEYAAWRAQDRGMIASSDYVLVLAMPGWEASVGVADELACAQSLGLPIYYIHVRQELSLAVEPPRRAA